MPTGKVKWYDADKGFGFLTRDDGGEVFVHSSALPGGVEGLKPGQKVEFGVAEGRRGQQALSVRVLEQPPTLAKAVKPKAKRKNPDELGKIVEDLIKLLDEVSNSYQRGKHPDGAQHRGYLLRVDAVHAKKIATVLRAVADDIDA